MGLGDLLEDALADVAPLISRPRRRALEIALLREEAADEAVDQRALAVAVRDALHLLGERQPVLLAVDDVQWLDASSSSALAFALRRLTASSVLVLLARRLGDGAESSELEQALDRIEWSGCRSAPSASARCIGCCTTASGGRSPARRCSASMSGRAATRSSRWSWHANSRRTSTRSSRCRCPSGSTSFSAHGSPDFPRRPTRRSRSRRRSARRRSRSSSGRALRRTRSSRRSPRTSSSAITARFASRIRCCRRSSTGPGRQRRNVHRRLADIVEDPVVRARHLALSSEEPDARRRRREDAATLAAQRGASAIAAELAEHALRLTPPDDADERRRRALTAARAHRAAGEWPRARTITSDLLAETASGRCALTRSSSSPTSKGSAGPSRCSRRRCARRRLGRPCSPSSSASLRGRRASRRASWARSSTQGSTRTGRRSRGRRAPRRALEIIAFLGGAVGDPERRPTPHGHTTSRPPSTTRGCCAGDGAIANVLQVRRSFEEARTLLQRQYQASHERDELLAAERSTASHGSSYGAGAGSWRPTTPPAPTRSRFSTGSRRRGTTCRSRSSPRIAANSSSPVRIRASPAARRGAVRPAHAGASRDAGRRLPPERRAARGSEWFDKRRQRLRGSAGTTPQTVVDRRPRGGVLELGRIDDAVRILDGWEADARRLEREWVLAPVTRCRGLVAAARGDVEEADSLLEDAVARHETVGDTFGRARALLALGVVRRRERQKRVARDTIEAALAGFEQLGAATWIAKAHGELGRIGGRTREEGLTTAERRVAVLVAEGRTNREVAAALFLGSGPSRRTSPTSTPSSACAPEPSSRGRFVRTSKVKGDSRFQAERAVASLACRVTS